MPVVLCLLALSWRSTYTQPGARMAQDPKGLSVVVLAALGLLAEGCSESLATEPDTGDTTDTEDWRLTVCLTDIEIPEERPEPKSKPKKHAVTLVNGLVAGALDAMGKKRATSE